MQAILLVLGAQTQELLFLSNQFQQSVVQISLYQDLKQKDVQIVQDLERLVIKFSLFPVSSDKMFYILIFFACCFFARISHSWVERAAQLGSITWFYLFIYLEVCACWEKKRWVMINFEGKILQDVTVSRQDL